jgi:hypothetical protein
MSFDVKDLALNALRPKPKPAVVLDGANEDNSLPGADSYTMTDIKLKAAAAIQQWVETGDLEEGESLADRLFALMVGIADANQDGEIDDAEQAVLDEALNCAWDYLEKFGVAEEDAGMLLNDWDNDAAERIVDLLAASLPEGEAADVDIDEFAFSDSDQEAVFDATYKKVVAVRGGKKVRISKRVAGTVRLTAKQKVAIRKAQAKSHSAAAMARRMKSMRVRQKSGL